MKELGLLDFNDDQWKAWTGLMKKTQQGDREAYERLLVEISPLVLNYVRKRVFNPGHVEDIYQETLLTFHKAKHTYRTHLPFAPWFFAVIRNAIWAALMKNHRTAEREVLMEDFPETAALEAAEEGVDDRLHRALRSLPKDNRQAVELLKFKGMSLEAAAKKLGISTAALKVRAHRGYGLLRKFLTTKQDEKE